MSYAGPVNKRRPDHRPGPVPASDWQATARLAAGVVLGIAVGAGATLLLAPQSGSETRHELARRGRRLRRRIGRRGHDAWADLGYELRRAARKATRTRRDRYEERRPRAELVDD